MTRKLLKEELKAIDAFVKTVQAEITPWQPTDSQQARDSEIPEEIKEMLLKLLPKSVNDHLLTKYLPFLNKSNYQDGILYWLNAIDRLSGNMKTSGRYNTTDKVHQILFREATRIAMETSLNFAAYTLNLITKLPYAITPALLMDFAPIAITRFKEQKEQDCRAGKDKESGAYGYVYHTYVDEDTLRSSLLAKHPAIVKFNPTLLHRTRSDSAALQHTSTKASSMSPLRPHEPVTNIFSGLKLRVC